MFFAIVAVLLLVVYLFHQHKYKFWINRGFVQLEPKFLIGDLGPMITAKKSIGEFFYNIYVKHKHHKVLGIYMGLQPAVVVNDPILLQNVLVRDFTSFHDRPVPFDLQYDKLQNHLFHVPGQEWRDLRVKLSPTFTSGKLKGMFSVIKDCGDVLQEYLVKNVKNGTNVFEFRELFARLNTSIISSVAFGIDNDCVNEPDHIFRRMGIKNFEITKWIMLRNMILFFIPQAVKYFKIKITNPEVEQFVYSVVKQTIEYREKNNVERNDFMQLLIQLKDQGYVSVDKDDNKADKSSGHDDKKKLSFDDLAANVFVFFQAGFETSSSTLSYCLFEMARHPEIQKKAQQEIDRVVKASGQNQITYEVLSELKYLQYCIDETLRKYPILPLMFRLSTADYKIPDTDQIIPKGTGVMIPVLGFQRDPEIYENPLEFKPERFIDCPTGSTAKGCYYLPFGDGPRNCIGMRMGKLTSKLGLMLVLSKFNVELADPDMADKELEFHPVQFILCPLKEFNLRITPRSSASI